jgi:hypothetical protein
VRYLGDFCKRISEESISISVLEVKLTSSMGCKKHYFSQSCERSRTQVSKARLAVADDTSVSSKRNSNTAEDIKRSGRRSIVSSVGVPRLRIQCYR